MKSSTFNGFPVHLIETVDELLSLKTIFSPKIMAGLDTETASLEYKADQIAGVCVSGGTDYSPKGYAGYYIPMRHIGYSANLPVEVVRDFVQWLIDNFQTVLFNRNFDTSMLEYDGVKIPFVGGMHDAQIMAYSVFNEAYPSLKDYSRRFLKWDMIDFAENKAKDHNFKTTDPTVSYIYAAGDPIATVFLARKLWSTYPYIRKIYKIDNYCLEAVRRLCQNELTLDYDFLETLRDETERHLAEIRTKIYSMSGVYGFNIDSSREKADVLSRFVTLTEKTKSGKFKTDEEALRRLNHPIANLMIDYAQTRVFLKSFVAKMCTYKGRTVRANYNTVNVPSGRLSSGASEGNPYFVPQNLQNCLVGDTRVQTKDGMKLLRDVKVGDYVWDGDEFRRITQKVNQGVRKVYKMSLADGKTLVGTADHPILSENGFVELAKCNGLRVALNSKKIYPHARYGFIRFRVGRGPYPSNKEVRYLNFSSPDLWGLIGMLVGDGSSSDRKLHICFDWHAISLCHRVSDVCRTLNIPHSIRTIKEKEGVHDIPSITIYNADLWRLAAKLGLTKTAREKSVPDVLYKLSPLCKMAFLKGLYAADGASQRYKTSPYIRTVSERLANGVVTLAETLGINAKATKYKNSQLGCGYAYTVSFLNPMNCQDVFTYEGQIKWAPEFHKKGLEKYVLPKSLGGYKQCYVVRHDPDYLRSKFWVKCLSVEEVGEEEVFDITVETSERFMANGIIVHNCPKDEEKLYLHHHPKIGYVLLREEEGCVRNAKGEPVKYKTKTGLHRAFIPHDKDWVIMSSDYASQELRVAANFSRDPNLLEPLLEGKDIHMHVAKQMFGYEDPLHRTKVKTINFASLYGAEYPTISARLGIPLQEGKTLMTRYKQTMSKLYAWKAEIVKAAKKRGYALTYFGRPVYLLKYFNSPDRGMSAYAERLAVNATIQGPVTPDTPVLLEDGYHLMKDVPDQGICATGEGSARYVKVFSGVQPIIEFEFEDGSILKCSKEHRLLSVQPSGLKWMKASEIVEGTPIASHTSSVEGSPLLFDLSDQGVRAVKVSPEINNRVEETLYWIGRAFGDGSFLESGVIHWVFGTHERDDRDRLVKWGNALGLHVNLQEFSKKDKSRRGDCLRATISSKNLCKLLKQIGVRFGVTSHDKRIPSRVFTASFEQRRQFVKGLFDSDGSKNWDWCWHMCNGDLLHDLQTLLLSMGVFSRWHKCKDAYLLTITSLKEFASLVGRERLISKCQQSRMLVPDYMASRFVEKYQSGELRYFRKGILSTDRTIICKLRKRHPVGYLKFVELCDRFGWDVHKEEDFYFYKKVKYIRALGESEVYCLSVEDPSHQFITNGVVSHNCILADTYIPSQDGKTISTMRNFAGQRVQFSKDERGTAHKGVPVFRGKLPCAMVEFLSGDFIMVSTNHKFLKYKSNTLLSIEEAAADAVQFVKPTKKVKLFKAILNTLLGRFKGTTLNSLAVFPRHDKPADSVEIATALFRAFIRDEHLITYNPVLAHSVRSLVDLYGYNLVKVCSGRYALSWSRAKKSKVCFVDNLKGTYDVMSPIMISGFQTYPLSGMIHKNTGADLMRLFLIKFTKLNIDDKDWRENTRMILPVHDEMNLEVSIPYMREAWLKMRKVMNFFPENFSVPIIVDTGVGTSWGNCLDVECISPKGRVVPKDIDPDDFSGEERAYLQEILEECVLDELPDRLKKFVKC